MDDSTSAALTEITVRIPADLARRLGTGGEVERRVLEALALDEFRQGHLGRVELRRLLGFATRAKLDEFLTGHGVFGHTRQTIWSATAATCSGSVSDPTCHWSSPMPGRCITSC